MNMNEYFLRSKWDHGQSMEGLTRRSVRIPFSPLLQDSIFFLFVYSICPSFFDEMFDVFIVSPFVLLLSVLIFPYRLCLHKTKHFFLFLFFSFVCCCFLSCFFLNNQSRNTEKKVGRKNNSKKNITKNENNKQIKSNK